ncbi:response regulator transcription factor [Streptomyces sp. CHA1]|uniref:response regulator transcription factor n=1 Tax=Streptomyces TaxID=1883 RepID=UPI0003C31FBB|nr:MULTISPECIES: response regulator transcription factor [unclassified Streptomyces]UYM25165.1 response regulator transcription factor [Streptomyces albus]WSB22666.1 response regulator transcription factor [Streptomyces albidoflavus]ESQ05813.1 Two-component system response regulator [Streptomyces sp. PVA_94-07]MBP3077310.1 chemotaxis protein CheY [Streptomyces sp. 604F]MBT3156470.1 response regulator transcription factor [Streptomyces sp. G11C]
MEHTQTSHNGNSAATPGAQRRVLVVEDDATIVEAISARLRAEGFLVQTATDGPAAVDTAEAWQPDLLILDIMLPGFDGLEVCRRVQAQRPVPVMMLTARDDETDMLVGLGVGADDYMTKPFSMRELAARVHVLLRRVERAALAAATPRSGILRFGELEIDHAQRRVRVHAEDVHLTPTEFDLLVCLANTPRAVLSREQLLAEVWDWADASGTRTVDSHIKALRRKIGAERIRTVHGVGYALETPTP